MRLDSFIDYIQAGKESYSIVGAFDQFEFAQEAKRFRRLSRNFELCVFSLNLVKQDLATQQNAFYKRASNILS